MLNQIIYEIIYEFWWLIWDFLGSVGWPTLVGHLCSRKYFSYIFDCIIRICNVVWNKFFASYSETCSWKWDATWTVMLWSMCKTVTLERIEITTILCTVYIFQPYHRGVMILQSWGRRFKPMTLKYQFFTYLSSLIYIQNLENYLTFIQPLI